MAETNTSDLVNKYSNLKFLHTILNMIPMNNCAGPNNDREAHIDVHPEGSANFPPQKNNKISKKTKEKLSGFSNAKPKPHSHDISTQASGEKCEDELHEKLRQKLLDYRGKRHKLNREEILDRRRQKKKLKRSGNKRNKSKIINQTDLNTKNKIDTKPTPGKPFFTSQGKLVYSKFDFSDAKNRKTHKSLSGFIGKDYKRILENLKKRQSHLQDLKEQDETAADEQCSKDAWRMAIGKAQGLKIKDDINLVNKALKKKGKREKQTKQKWKQRENTVAKQKNIKQDKRAKNIEARKREKIDNKIKRARKKGRIPGF